MTVLLERANTVEECEGSKVKVIDKCKDLGFLLTKKRIKVEILIRIGLIKISITQLNSSGKNSGKIKIKAPLQRMNTR